MRIYNQDPQPSAILSPPFGRNGSPIVQAIDHQIATPSAGSTDTYNLRPNSGVPSPIMMLHPGASAIDVNYANIFHGVGFFDGASYFYGGTMQDPELTPESETRRTVSSKSIQLVSQGVGAGIQNERDVQATSYDQFITEVITHFSTLRWNSLAIPFTNVKHASVGNLSLGVGTAAIPMGVGHDTDLLILVCCDWDRSPADNDIEAGARYTGNAGMSVGFALNQVGDPQYCMGHGEQNGVAAHDVSYQIRNNRALGIVNNGLATEKYNGLVSWVNNRPHITPSASAGNSYVGYLAIKFYENVNLALLSTSAPTSGRWVDTSLNFRPSSLMGYFGSGLTYNAVLNNQSAIGFLYGDHFQARSISFSSDNLQTVTDNTAVTSMASDLTIIEDNGAQTTLLKAPMFRMRNDGFETTPSIYPASAIPGFMLAIGGD